jgi:hypothetical protein
MAPKKISSSPKKGPAKKTTSRKVAAPPPGLHIFDLVGNKVVGEIQSNTSQGITLKWAALLTFHPVPIEGGRRFNIVASLAPMTPCLPEYTLTQAGVRGFGIERRPWLTELYARYTERAERGEFDLNPYAPPERMVVQQGTGSIEDETATVETIVAEASTPNATQAAASSNVQDPPASTDEATPETFADDADVTEVGSNA